tara:strand:- start:780 stop:884 length:105 start_codon:yes stop_codon:yes gene_type:complete
MIDLVKSAAKNNTLHGSESFIANQKERNSEEMTH